MILFEVFYLPVFLERHVPSHSFPGRFELWPRHYLYHWVCRWFESHQRSWSSDPTKEMSISRHVFQNLSYYAGVCLYAVQYLVSCDTAVNWVCVFKIVCLFHLVDFVFHCKSPLHKWFVWNHDLEIFHHFTGCINIYVLIIISRAQKTKQNNNNKNDVNIMDYL